MVLPPSNTRLQKLNYVRTNKGSVQIVGHKAKDLDLLIEGASAFVTDALWVPPYSIVGLNSLIEESKEYNVVQYHIDPDAFERSATFGKYFEIGHTYRSVRDKGDAHMFIWDETPELHFELIRKIMPNFVGIFQFQLYGPGRALRESELIKGIETLIEKTVPDAKNIILDKRVLENPSLYDAFKSSHNLYPYDYNNPSVSSEIQELIRSGRTFGIFDSHAHALATFRYR